MKLYFNLIRCQYRFVKGTIRGGFSRNSLRCVFVNDCEERMNDIAMDTTIYDINPFLYNCCSVSFIQDFQSLFFLEIAQRLNFQDTFRLGKTLTNPLSA